MSENIVTDYRKDSVNTNTTVRNNVQRYRCLHWLEDIIKNLFADSVNLKDERISEILGITDGTTETQLNGLVYTGVPYSSDSKKAGQTPAIIISVGQSQYQPDPGFGYGGVSTCAINNVSDTYIYKFQDILFNISVITESYDGTILLMDIIDQYLCKNLHHFKQDNRMVVYAAIAGISEVQGIENSGALQAKSLYQQQLTLKFTCSIRYTTDTQGPVFRGVSTNNKLV